MKAERLPFRGLVWGGFALLLAVAPLVFSGGLGLAMLSQMGIAILACLSYNLLFGQGGMPSFGHAVYTGLAAFVAVHALNRIGDGSLPLPVSLLPLVGGLAGLAFALPLGWLSTRRAGTTFAMITLGIGELVFALAPLMPGFFGGEGGVSTDRVVGAPVLGISYGPQWQVYGLIAVYTFAGTAALYAFTRTPLGRILEAVRDDPERAEFVGYSARRVRHLAFVIAGFFAGIAGGLQALNFEIATAELVGTTRSGGYLLFTLLGGAGFFFGPIVGGVLMVVATVWLSAWTKAWLLYLGLAFLLTVMYAPGGIASLLAALWRVAARGRLRAIAGPGLALGGALAVLLAGATALVEMVYHLQLGAALGPRLEWLGVPLDTSGAGSWAGAALLLVAGGGLFEFARRRFVPRWQAVQAEIEAAEVRPPELEPADVRQSPGEPGEAPRATEADSTVPALELRGLRKAFGRTQVIRGATLALRPGERVALIGPNGAGKSTLFDLVSGRAAPDAGEVRLGGRRIDGLPPYQVRRLGLARSFQVSRLFGRLSVFDNLRCALLWPLGVGHACWRSLDGQSEVNARAEGLIARLHLAPRRDTPAAQLSYAEQRALEVGLAVAGGAPIVLLDEPTAGMSRSETQRFVALVRELTEGRTLLVVEHDMSVVFGLADRVAVLVQGEVIAFDTPEAVRADPRVREAYLGALPPGGQGAAP